MAGVIYTLNLQSKRNLLSPLKQFTDESVSASTGSKIAFFLFFPLLIV